ncbi:MAG: hypothetical protein R3298_06975 [Gammaproteobacteria bacterium]|nr:hypothetical protein [Gammaproteobacteria bacterium]
MSARPNLHVIQGGRRTFWRRGDLELVAAGPGNPPFSVERTVVEEDRWRVVGAPPDWRPPRPEHPVRLHTALIDDAPERLGRVLEHGQNWHAVVVDVDADPLVRPEAVRAALARVTLLCARHAVTRLAVPLLGTIHGDLDPARALAMVHDALLVRPPADLRRIWLQVPPRHRVRVEQGLAAWGRARG